jgi:cyclopropane fatty-acyl-phospholipid synthase-like methyltransferase
MTDTITACRLCGTPLPALPILHMAHIPSRIQYFPTKDDLAQDRAADLQVYECSGCGLVQLNTPPVVYAEGATSTTAYSAGMMSYRQAQIADFVSTNRLQGKRVLDVGCGDGHLLKFLEEAGAKAFGIDASQKAVDLARERGLNARVGYVTRNTQVEDHLFDAFVSTDVLEHVPDLKDFLQGICANLREGAVGLIESHTIDKILETQRFYDFVLDHLSYFTLRTMRLSLELSGFEVLHIERNRDGENITAIVRKPPAAPLETIRDHHDILQANLSQFREQHAGKQLAIWGASFQTLTLLALGMIPDVAFIIDSAPYKQGKYSPVSHIPIVSPAHLESEPAEVVLIIASRYESEIIEQIQNQVRFKGTLATLQGADIRVLQQA